MRPLALLLLPAIFPQKNTAGRHGITRSGRSASSFILGGPLARVSFARACQRNVVVEDDARRARARARASPKGLPGREIARRGRRPRRSSHPLLGWREPPPRERCWTVRAGNVPRVSPPAAAAPSSSSSFSLLPPTTRRSRRERIYVRAGSRLSLSVAAPFLIYPSLSLVPIYLAARDRRALSLSPVDEIHKYVCIHGAARNDTTDGRRARARALSAQPVFEFARACVYSISATRRA